MIWHKGNVIWLDWGRGTNWFWEIRGGGPAGVCGVKGSFPPLYTLLHSTHFSPLTLFDCERGREEKENEKGGASVSLFPFCRRWDTKRRTEEEGNKSFLACQELSHNPLSDLRHTLLSLSIQSPPSSERFYTPIHANLHSSPRCPPSFLLFLSHLPPLLLLRQRYLARLIVM